MVKDLVVNLTGGHPQDFAADFALSMAASYAAHALGVGFIYEPVIPGDMLGGIPTDLIDVQREENRKAAEVAASRFEAAAKAGSISAETRILDASLAGAPDLFGRIARRYDIAVVGQARREQGASEELLIEGALFGSGRPIVVVPYTHKEGLKLDRVLICWDGSRPAARAIADAIPLLARAKTVEIVVVIGERDKSGELTGTNMRRHLVRHGIETEIKHIVASGGVAQNAILAHAAASGATFMVMGGYGHSRLREFILGGVTRGILKSMPVPVLMSH
ncbi:MAG TPA: universal stress protein [Xanthobacteraceae bacterium]|jgi:nucleotide-binding universal stress UspA family protein